MPPHQTKINKKEKGKDQKDKTECSCHPRNYILPKQTMLPQSVYHVRFFQLNKIVFENNTVEISIYFFK